MKTISVRKARSMVCPVCGSKMDYMLPPVHRPTVPSEKVEVQNFQCKGNACRVKLTLWNLVVNGLDKEYEKLYKEREGIINSEPDCDMCGRKYCCDGFC